jgi:hypothetical protein
VKFPCENRVYSPPQVTCEVVQAGELWLMRGQKVLAKQFEFYFADLDNSILVENTESGTVIIRAVRDNVSEERKAFFIRQLATEGFIPDMFQWFHGATGEACGVRWVVDHSWLKIPLVVKRRAATFICGLMIFCCLVWLVMMALVILPHVHLRFENTANQLSHPAATENHFGRDNR